MKNRKSRRNKAQPVTESVTVPGAVAHSAPAPSNLGCMLKNCSLLRLLELAEWLDGQAVIADGAALLCAKAGKADLAQLHRSFGEIKRQWADKLREFARSKTGVEQISSPFSSN